MHYNLREALLAFEAHLMEEARVEYRHQVSLYVAGGLKEQPAVPEILRA